jgi:hypothetical protein
MFSRLELRFSKILGKIFFLHADLLGLKFLIFFFITLFLGAFFWPRYQARTSRFFTIFLTVFLALSSFMTAAECMDNNNEAPHPQVPAAPPAGLEEDIRGTLLNIVSEPAGPLELPSIIREMRGFFSHYATGGRNPSTRNIQTWLATEFSIDQSQTDERAAIIAAMQEIKEEYPPDSLSPGQAKDHLYNRMNTWLDARGRENLNLRKTSWPPLS